MHTLLCDALRPLKTVACFLCFTRDLVAFAQESVRISYATLSPAYWMILPRWIRVILGRRVECRSDWRSRRRGDAQPAGWVPFGKTTTRR